MASLSAREQSVVEPYVTWLRSWGASKTTIHARQTLTTSRLRAWGGVSGFTLENVEAFLADPKFSAWTRATYHAHLTCICAWLVVTGRLADNPMLFVRKPRRPHGKPRPLSEPEVAKVLAVAEGRVRSWVLLGLLAGLRASEIARIRGEDVSVDGIYVLGKGGTQVTLPCHPDLWDLAQRYPATGFWFPGSDEGHMRGQQISVAVGKFFAGLGIEGSVHRCRHVFGTRLLRAGVHIRTVQKLMRHANLDTTAGYTAVDEDELRAAIILLRAA